MAQDAYRSPSGGHNPEHETTNPKSRKCEILSTGTRPAAPHLSICEDGDGLSSSTPTPGILASGHHAWSENEAHPSRIIGRIVEVRRDIFGDEGGNALAESLQLPERTWANFERGVVMPASVLLRFLKLTSVEPHWLLTGRGPKYHIRSNKHTQKD